MMLKMILSVLFSIAYLCTGGIRARPEGGFLDLKTPTVLKSREPDTNVVQEMKKFKLEVLKTKILKEIKLSEPPVVQGNIRVPKNMLKLLNKNFEEENSTDDGEEFIIYPSNDDFECRQSNETSCSRLEFQLELENKTVSSVYIWFQKKTPKKDLFVAVGYCASVEEEGNCATEEVLSETKTEFGWSVFNIPQRLIALSQNDNGFMSVEAFGSNLETKGDGKPFLVVNLNTPTSERKRRSTRTVSDKLCASECCKIDFYISFKEIGWHFVVAPAGFHANMCYGKCTNDRQNEFPSHYHSTMNLALANKTTIVDKKEYIWTPCCSPTNLRPLNMIYKAANDTTTNSTHTLVHHEIPDMIAESCGCW